jgi:hypothetical protein
MATKNTETAHELTRAEIARQITHLFEENRQFIEQRVDLQTRASTGGGYTSSLSVDERAALAYAKIKLNGHAPPSLEPSSELDFSSLDRQLAVKQRGNEIAIKILSDKDLLARAAEAVNWAETHADRWRQLVHETIVTAAKLEALELAVSTLIGECVDIDAISLPMANMVGHRCMNTIGGRVEVRPSDLIEAGLKAGLVTQREIEKAKNV